MRAGRLGEALRLRLAEQATAGQRVCLPAHGLLATILLRLGRRREASVVVSHALGS